MINFKFDHRLPAPPSGSDFEFIQFYWNNPVNSAFKDQIYAVEQTFSLDSTTNTNNIEMLLSINVSAQMTATIYNSDYSQSLVVFQDTLGNRDQNTISVIPKISGPSTLDAGSYHLVVQHNNLAAANMYMYGHNIFNAPTRAVATIRLVADLSYVADGASNARLYFKLTA